MALIVDPAAAQKISAIFSSRYFTFQSPVVAQASDNTFIFIAAEPAFALKVPPGSTNASTDFFNSLNVAPSDIYDIRVNTKGEMLYVILPAFKTSFKRFFYTLFKNNTATLRDTLQYEGGLYSSTVTPLLFGGNAPWFKVHQLTGGASQLYGKCFQNGSQIYNNPTDLTTNANPGTTAVQADPTLSFINSPEAPGGLNANAISSLPPIIWGGVLLNNSGTYLDLITSQDTSRHIFAYNSSKDYLFIIVSGDNDGEMENVINTLYKVGFDYVVLFDGSSSVVLWQYGAKGFGTEIFKASLFQIAKNPYLHIGYGIASS